MSERYQERVCKTEIQQAYDNAYWKIEQLMYKSNCYHNYSKYDLITDLEAMLFVIADFTACNLDNRDIIKNDLFPNFKLNFYFVDSDKYRYLKSRIEFYSKIVDGSIKLRGDCLLIDVPPSIANNPCTRCAIAFCDILTNPLLVVDYVISPVELLGFDKNFDFASQTVMPMIDIILEYMAKIMELCGVNIEDENPPINNTIPETRKLKGDDAKTIENVFIIFGVVAIILVIVVTLLTGDFT